MKSDNKARKQLKNKKQRSPKEQDKKLKNIAQHATKLLKNRLVHSPSVHRVSWIH